MLTLIRNERNIIYNELKHQTLNISTLDIEMLITELKIGHVKKMIIVNCYRPPSGKITECFDEIEESLDKIDKLEEFELYVNGDFNIAYNMPDSTEHKRLKIFERKYNLTQLIKTPTRCTSNTRNILDLMLTTSNYIISSGSEEVNISDHQPVWLIRKKQQDKPTFVDFECRCFANYDKTSYQNDLLTYDWGNYYSENCPNNLWVELVSTIITIADRHCPFKLYRHKRKLPPWLTQDILDLIHLRDSLYKKAKKKQILMRTGVRHAKLETYVIKE